MRSSIFFAAWMAIVVGSSVCHGQGVLVSAGGPVHRGMGGASTAAPVSASGSLYWNPATISGLQDPELEFGVDLLFTDHRVDSTFGAFSGSTEADPGTFPVPNVGWVHKGDNPAVTFGLGIHSVAGLKTNLPSDPTNPVLAPPLAGGLGRVSSEATFLQIAPVLSVACSDRFSVAAGPIITTAQVGLEPFVFDAANGDGTYASGRATRYHWGGGLQAGVYYVHENGCHAGASLKSPSWMERFEFYGVDETGLPRTLHAKIDLPLILSVGLAYSGLPDWTFALDTRYIDYENADGFGDPATFDATGRLSGLDWSSVVAVAAGVQRSLGKRIFLRGGYTYNSNPISDGESFFNIASPLIYQHMLSVGGSYKLNDKLAVNVGYSHYFENSVVGPIFSPAIGAVPGSSVTNHLTANFLSFGVVMRQ